MFKKQYRIVKDDWSGFEVQARRWWFPIWIQCTGQRTGINTHPTMQVAKTFIMNRTADKEQWRGTVDLLKKERVGVQSS